MKTIQDLLTSIDGLSGALKTLGDSFVAAQPPPVDYSSIISIIDSLTAQVQALTQKLAPAPPAPAQEPQPAPPAA